MVTVNRKEKKVNATLNIDGATVKQGLRNMVAQGNATQYQADLIAWLFAFGKTNNLSLTQLSAELGYDSNSTLWRVFRNEYGARVDKICAKIERYKKIAEERSTYGRVQFIETSIARRIFKACDAALISQTIVFIYGDSQIGKTTALQEYARRNNHGQTRYIRLPAGAGAQRVAKEFAKASFISTKMPYEKIVDGILAAIDHNNLILIDEGHQPFLSYQNASTMKVFELIREIYDRTQCGMVICATNVLRKEIQEGKHAQMLEQLRRRCTHPIQLPSKPPRQDLDKIAAGFNLRPAEGDALEIIKDMIHTSGLGMYVKFLQAAVRIASKEKKKVSWSHFVLAHDLIKKLGERK
jgi:DNA transposition AAA+ family ATPase